MEYQGNEIYLNFNMFLHSGKFYEEMQHFNIISCNISGKSSQETFLLST